MDRNPPSLSRQRKQEQMLLEAERQFARFGFEGVSLDTIASALGLSRHNMLYYYASKEELYLAVLNNVLTSWLDNLDDFSLEADPETAISNYVRVKLRFSQERPLGSAVFAREVLGGAQHFAATLKQSVIPKLKADVRIFERWAKQGKIARVNFTHLMFIIWSATQAYADQSAQFALYMGKAHLTAPDFEAAHVLITKMVWATLQPP